MRLSCVGKIYKKRKIGVDEMNNSKEWSGTFGTDYIERNSETPYELDEFYRELYGLTRTEMNKEFLQGIKKDSSFFECGCNIGTQIQLLNYIGYDCVDGIEINEFAAEKAALKSTDLSLIKQGDFLDFNNEFNYNVVYTSGVLIHIPPKDREAFIQKMIRLSSKYLWIFEYFSDTFEMIPYRGKDNMMWRGNFEKLFLKNGCRTLKKEFYNRTDGNVDCMVLMEKGRLYNVRNKNR